MESRIAAKSERKGGRPGAGLATVLTLSMLGAVALGTHCRPGEDQKRVEPQPTARVTFLKGTAQVIRSGTTTPLAFGSFLLAEDVLETGEGGEVELFLKGQGLVRIGPATRVRVETLTDQNASLQVQKGEAAAFLRRQDRSGEFSISTPTAIASVRGTVFLVRADAQRATVSLVSGSVEVLSRAGGSVVLEENTEVAIERGRKLTRAMVRPLSPKALERVRTLAVFHKNNILEHTRLVDELKGTQALRGLDVKETVEGRYARLRDEDRPTDTVRETKRADERFIKRDIDEERIKLKPKRDYDTKR